ncbi:TonB-dependent receptor [Geofilum sp. OHC36d9]|uniref:TonB-dependent receptor n=1 Tax=Geofilum sp. OHC36d9 TaxID=3458413 RepID=UPI00403478EB
MKKNHFLQIRIPMVCTKTFRIMRLTLILIFVSVGQLFAEPSYAQTKMLDLNIENESAEKILEEIENQSDFYFLYNKKMVDVNFITDAKFTNTNIFQILHKIFDDRNITYKVEGQQIILTKESNTQTQLHKITGTVTDSSGEPLPGVSIVVKGTTTGTITDLDGNFSIQTKTDDQVLIFSFIGFENQEIIVGNQSKLNITLQESNINLKELVVIGYGTMRKSDVTSAVASVKTDDFVKGSVQDVGQLIQGKVAGLTIASVSGDPTANTQIRLRGNTTLYGTSTSPLIIIDGVPGDFNSVAPEDIESIDVLKDGSAAAIYGTRGTNGVIIITTKRASGNYNSTVEYSGYTSTQVIAKQLNMLTASDYRQQIADGTRNAEDDLGASTDWLDQITRTPFTHVHNLIFRGGNEKTNYLASVNYNNAQGIFLKSDKETFTVRTDVNHTMFEGLAKVNMGIISRNTKYTTTGDGYGFNGYTYRQAVIYNPTTPIKDETGEWTENTGAFNYDNPLARLMECDGKNSDQWTRFNSTISIFPFSGMVLKALMSYSKYNQTRGYYETSKNISTKRSGLNGYASNGAVESIDRLAEITAEYSNNINVHRFSVLGGYSYSENDWRDFYQTNQDFPTDAFGYNNIDLGQGIDEQGTSSGIGSSRTETNLIGFFSRVTYSYDDRYLFMGSMRYEAASQLWGTKEPWGLFPSASLGWRISNESFMENISFVNDLKLRAGYGITGTQPASSFLGVATMGYTGQVYSNGGWVQTIGPTRNENPYLKWEEKKETNIGLDFGLFDNRISGTIDYYNRDIDGLLWDYAVPVPPNMVSTTTANVGVMTNQGYEVLINSIPIQTQKFKWNTTLSFSTNSNTLKSLSNDLYQSDKDYFTTGSTGEPIQTYTHRVDIGGPIGNFFGFKVIDVDSEGKWVYEDAEGNAIAYDDFEKSDENKQILGNGLPKYYASWNNTFKYKNFDLNISMRGAFDFQILNFDRMYLENTKTVQYNRLKSAYDKVFGKAVLSDEVDLEYNSYYIEDGDFWKIDNITLGYNIPVSSQYIKNLRVYASSLNTATFTGYKGIDPEVTVNGLAPGNDYRDKYPTTRTYTIGVNVSF